MSSKGRPIHFTDRELNEKPSPAEPSKSYEETSQYLDDDYFLSESENYHRSRGDMYSYEPHPSSLGPDAATARLVRPVGKRQVGAASILHVGADSKSATPVNVDEKECPTSPAANTTDRDPPCQFRSPATPGKGKGSFKKTIQSFDDIDTLQSGSVSPEHSHGDSEYQVNAFPRSPTSCPSFTSITKAKRGGRNESYATTTSTLTEDGHGGVEGDAMSGFASGVGVMADSELSRMLSSSSITQEGSVRSRGTPKPHTKSTTNAGRKHAKWHSKKRARAREIRYDALSGSHEFGHDSGLPGEALEHKVDSTSLGGGDALDSLRGKRAERVRNELCMARTSKKLFLKDLNLTARELPRTAICSSPLGAELHKLCLAGNHLKHVPDTLTQHLTGLRSLDLQQCKLVSLPDNWDLPNLRRLNLSHNNLKSFFVQNAFLGLPNLEHLNMSNNGICEIHIPDGFSALEYLDLSFNDISYIPEDFLQLEKLKVLRLSNNFISHVPATICRMPLSELDVTPNPLIQPPTGDCEQGIHVMRRYYLGLDRKEQKRQRSARKNKKYIPKVQKAKVSVIGRVDVGSALPTAPPVVAKGKGLISRKLHMQEGEAGEESKSMTLRFAAASRVTDGFDISVTKNDSLKVIFVGMSYSGKTTVLKRLKYGLLAEVPKREERTIGVNIDMWSPKDDCAKYSIDVSHIDTQIVQEGALSGSHATDIKFSMWDFAGQTTYHATHEIFFSQTSLYVLVWDMAAKNEDVRRSAKIDGSDDDPFQWNDSSDEEDDDPEQDARRADRALEHDIDEKVQYWVDCIRSSVPGAVILPVATFDDCFDSMGGAEEATRRCNKMKERLLNKEQTRIEGLRKRLEKLESGNRANSAAAMRLKELISPFRLPKIIFGDGAESVLRVSGKFNTGFEKLRQKLIHVATGKDRGGTDYPLFRGHVGSTIPPLRIKIRDLVREKRANFQVVEWEHFVAMLAKSLDCSFDNELSGQISDGLRWLSSVGEISYFGEALPLPSQSASSLDADFYDSSDNEDEDDGYALPPDDLCNATLLPTNPIPRGHGFAQESSRITLSGLSQYIFFNPLWLCLSLRVVLRHDLKQQLDEVFQTKDEKTQTTGRWHAVGRGHSFHDASLRCPIISAKEARMLWESKGKIAKSARRATLDTSAPPKQNVFDFVLRLLVHFGVFVPIDFDSATVVLDGEIYAPREESGEALSTVFFLPSQLKTWERPSDEMWTYKTKDVRRTCLCQTWLFPDGAPPGLEHLTAEVLRTLYDATSYVDSATTITCRGKDHCHDERGNGQLSFERILCWKTAFKIVLAKTFIDVDGEESETLVEIWCHLVDQGSPFCVAGDTTGVGMKRLLVSAKGTEGRGCRNIWEGGYDLVLKAADHVIKKYRGLDFTKQGVCPRCLETRNLRDAMVWNWTQVQDAVEGRGELCCEHGHEIDVRHVAGCHRVPTKVFESEQPVSPSFIPYSNLCAAVVLVGLWDGEQSYVCRAGTGFVVDKRYGLIVTAAHNVINMEGANEAHGSWKRRKSEYYGLKRGRAVIGVIPGHSDGQQRRESLVGPEAYFRYFAEIVAEDISNMDACVLKITGRMQHDVGSGMHECGTLPVNILPGREDIESEGLHQLQVSGRCELEEQVRLLGFTQGGEGLVPMGSSLNRALEVVKGDIVKKYRAVELYHGYQVIGHVPRYEIVINCPLTIMGQSGCPCVNQAGQVVGILSRADAADKQRCYLVPTREFMELVTIARSWED